MADLFPTQPLKGMMDDFPDLMAEYNWMKEKIDHVAHAYRYQEYDAPALEPLDIFAAKSSEELVKQQSYTFTDRGNREITLRPEMTPSLARMVAKVVKEKPKPFRWYSIPKCYRYERPQKGRLREFRQLNVDLIGDHTVLSDLEMMSFVTELMKSFQVPVDAFEVQVNHRGMLASLLDERGFDHAEKKSFMQLVDRKNKMPDDVFAEQIQQAFSEKEKINFLDDYLAASDPTLLFKDKANPSLLHFQSFLRRIGELGLAKNVKYTPSVMRGLDYYTGLVFEVFSISADIKRALFGGGRYDNLIGMYSKESVSGIGFGMGIYIMSLFLQELGLMKIDGQANKGCSIGLFSEDFYAFGQKVAFLLRREGYAVDVNLIMGGVKKFFQRAESKKIQSVVVIGEDEIKSGKVNLKELAQGEVREIEIQ